MDSRLALPANTVLDGSYRILRVVGSGGFGVTYSAEDTNLGTLVAIKEYYPADFADRDATMRVRPKSDRHKQTFEWGISSFLQEARMLARFKHASIVRVSRVFEAYSTAYMVMEFEQGQNFDEWLAGLGRPPTQDELDRIATPLLDALELMHAESFLHRDIAPDNIVIRPDGSPVLLDFGAARRSVGEMSRSLTGIVKAGYSPHEQYATDGRLQGPWSDFYALGATLYRAVTGKAPEEATLRMADDRVRPAVEASTGTYRRDFLAAIDSCLQPKHTERPQSVAQLRPALLGQGRLMNYDARPSATRKIEIGSARRSKAGIWFAVAAVLAVVGGAYGGFEYTRRSSDESAKNEAKRLSDAAAANKRTEEEAVQKARAKERAARDAETRRLASAAKKKADDEALAKARVEAEAQRQQQARAAAEKKAAEERAFQTAEAKRQADLAEQLRRASETKKTAPTIQTPALHRVLTDAEERELAPKQEFQECKDCPRMVVVPAGTFLMGSPPTEAGRSDIEAPQHSVTIGKAFASGKFEVTFDQYKTFVQETGRTVANTCSDFDPTKNAPISQSASFWYPGFTQEGNHPAVCVSWQDAKDYVAWLSKKLARDYRLLSEAEWEYAARAGSQTRYHFGENEMRLCEFGNVADSADPSKLGARPLIDCRDGYLRTAPVGRFAANQFGLHDTIGNVWEWVEDCGHANYEGAPSDGSAWLAVNCSTRVSRGGGWGSIAPNLRSAARNARFGADDRYYFLGFRVARTLQTAAGRQ